MTVPPGRGDGAARAPAGGAAWVEGGGAVGHRTVRRLTCDAVLQRVVRGDAGEVLALGREVRLASRAQRRALAARDRGCIVPGCGAPPDACDAHHVQHWADGGPTDLGNLALLCGSHHTAVHAGVWSVTMGHDGIPEVVPPRWVDPDRRPRRLWHHLVAGAASRAHAEAAAGPTGTPGTPRERAVPVTTGPHPDAPGPVAPDPAAPERPDEAGPGPGGPEPSRRPSWHPGAPDLEVLVRLPAPRSTSPAGRTTEQHTSPRGPVERWLSELLDTG